MLNLFVYFLLSLGISSVGSLDGSITPDKAGGGDNWNTSGGGDNWNTSGGGDNWNTSGGGDNWNTSNVKEVKNLWRW